MTSTSPSGRIVRAVALAILFVAGSARSADRSLEYGVKATFLYKFASFVEWPAGSFENETSPFNLCVIGADPFGGRIKEAVADQSVGRHPIVLIHLERVDPRFRCHAMFVNESAGQPANETLSAVNGTATLTVTDSALGRTAGIIHFVIDDDRVSFDIDNVGATQNHLVISSKLLAIARRVRTAGTRNRS